MITVFIHEGDAFQRTSKKRELLGLCSRNHSFEDVEYTCESSLRLPLMLHTTANIHCYRYFHLATTIYRLSDLASKPVALEVARPNITRHRLNNIALEKFYSIFYSICRFLGIIAERVIL